MQDLLCVFLLIPALGFLLILLAPRQSEELISWAAFIGTAALLVLGSLFTLAWLAAGRPALSVQALTLYKTEAYTFSLDLYFDKVTAAYLLIGSLLITLIIRYSRYYLHREEGYKRFFSTLLFFFLGYNLAILSGNFEVLFTGWELLGISSFLLIAFYRRRYLPVKNAVKIFSIYRTGDVGILLAMWMSHHLWNESITFQRLLSEMPAGEHLRQHSGSAAFISLMLLLAAAAKSAQMPFSSWLPRAMEGPTPSSAIFYGALSVHMGVFLMLRSYPFWEHQLPVRILIGVLGLASSLAATGAARVQSSIKSQIAYASIAQIGLMFIEIALGWRDVALLHLAGNAFLRTYQLLVSPSVVSYLIREQFYKFEPARPALEDRLPASLRNSLYVLYLQEWNLDTLLYSYLWRPLKWAGQKLNALRPAGLAALFLPAYGLGIVLLFRESWLPVSVRPALPLLFGVFGLLMVLKSFAERSDAMLAWLLILMNHYWVALAVSFNEHYSGAHTLMYLSGASAGTILGYGVLSWLKRRELVDLGQFHGHGYEHPRAALLFLISCLAITGFPISPTFIGEDLIFSHIHEDQWHLAAIVALSFILDGLAAVRIYARIFLGPHAKRSYPVAYRSS